MKKLSNLMLAAVATAALATPAMAWDFKAQGSVQAQFNQTSSKSNSDADAVNSTTVSSEAGGITVSSTNTDGDNTVTFKYTLDIDGGLDEAVSVSGSTKVGNWTATGTTSHNRYDNTAMDGNEDSTAVTVTDGTMTITLGDAGHLPNGSKKADTVAGGALTFDSADDDIAIGAFIDGFHGVSLGYKVDDATSVTVALQASADDNESLGGTVENLDGEGSDHGVSGNGLSVSTVAGPASITFTYASSKTSNPKDSSDTSSTSSSTMGLGVGIDLGDIKPFFNYGTASAKGADSEVQQDATGMELGLTYMLGTDSVVFYYGTLSEGQGTGEADSDPTTSTGMELGYNTTVGAAALGIGYGMQSKKDGDDATIDGYSMTDLEVRLSYSF